MSGTTTTSYAAMQVTAPMGRLLADLDAMAALAERYQRHKFSSATKPRDALIPPVLPYKTIRRHQARIHRNQPCPCGSGKKFKRCHL